jgi:glycosyltransferase involved in cell wall biosynthesis
LNKSKICEKCIESCELSCILQNCRNNFAESAAYALRSYIVRKFGWIQKAVTRIITPSEFVRQKLISAGFRAKQIQTIWNAVEIPEEKAKPETGGYVAFAGRLSQEKGVEVLLKVARSLPDVPFHIAGTGPMENEWRMCAPSNVKFMGFLGKAQLYSFYQNARLLVVPSLCYESFAITAAEGMACGLPIAASRIGGMPELICGNRNGFLLEPGNIDAWSTVINKLWRDPQLCREIGLKARKWAKIYLTKELYISKLIAAYRDAQDIVSGRNNRSIFA